ncbi:MAG: GTPase HflX [Chlamydiota bacterium]|nr:GTPase HflX [Chlamydiota bacterium]
MRNLIDLQRTERAYLVGIESRSHQAWESEDSIKELIRLTDTAGAEVVGSMIVRIKMLNPAYYIGQGKISEIAQICTLENINVIIFDVNLSPAQVKNIQALCPELRIIDRTQLILDIFARRARTTEAQLEIEFVQLEYLLPRLTGQWTHLSRQVGGIGTRGPGETQLEVDRRRVMSRIITLKKELNRLQTSRTVQRKKRLLQHIPLAAIIGYTNAGKTTLFNWISGSQNFTEDRLFATLDTTVRQIDLENSKKILVADTVGFLQRLPHNLIASFKTTLDEVRDADLLIHVIDISDPLYQERMESVHTVLQEMEVEKPMILVFNKVDLLDNLSVIDSLLRKSTNAVAVSAKAERGLEALHQLIDQFLCEGLSVYYFFIPHQAQDSLTYVYRSGRVLHKSYDADGVNMKIEMDPRFIYPIKKYLVNHPAEGSPE